MALHSGLKKLEQLIINELRFVKWWKRWIFGCNYLPVVKDGLRLNELLSLLSAITRPKSYGSGIPLVPSLREGLLGDPVRNLCSYGLRVQSSTRFLLLVAIFDSCAFRARPLLG